jgi:competence protein ComEA
MKRAVINLAVLINKGEPFRFGSIQFIQSINQSGEFFMFKKMLAFVAAMYVATSFAAVDVNNATAADLDGIKGIGPGISSKILDERKKGKFKDWSDFIERVKSIGEGNAAKFSAQGMTVDGASFVATKSVAKKKKENPAAKAEAKKAEAKPAAATPTSTAAATPAAAKPAAGASAAKK